MSNRIIYLVRHAEPASDGKRRFLGQADPDLSEVGWKQAEACALSMANCNLSGIYSSDLLRALHTAEKLAAKHGLNVKTDKRLREINLGEWDGMTFEDVEKKWPGAVEKRMEDLANFHTTGGESFTEVRDRAWPAFLQIITESTGNIAIVAHAGVIRVSLCMIMSVPLQDLFSIKVEYASPIEVVIRGDGYAVEGKKYKI